MKTTGFAKLAVLPLLALAALGARAEDIDIYNGTTINGPNPNVLIIVDNTSSNDAAYTSVCPFTGPPGNLPNSNLLDMVYCSLYGALETVRTQPTLFGKLNIGLMSGGSGSNKGGEMYYPATSPYNLPVMDASGIAAFQSVITAGIPKATGNAKLDGDMQEAWAFFTGHTGPRSGTSYTSHIGTLACQRSFIILIGAASKQGRTNNGSGFGSASELAAAGATPSQQVKINTNGTPSFGPNTGEDNAWIDEWARFFNQSDFNTTSGATDKQNIVTYTIAAGGQVADYVQILKSTGHYGGGDSFVGSDYTSLRDALVKIFYDVQAINSVFASPGLPVSTNAQGTYLNQIFIATFRPDANGKPRWMGNLKQYQFGVNTSNPTAPTLFLADASWGPYQPNTNANSALSTAGTGFFSPTAVSFWTSKDATKLPDSAGGFWVNNAQGSGGAFDLPDGQYVEKGGVSQQIRLKYLTDTYTGASPTTARNLYTCFGSNCIANASLSGMPFKTSNTDLTATALGISNPISNVGVNSISRSSATGNVTLTLAQTPSPAIGDPTTIFLSGSTNSNYDGSLAALAPTTTGTTVTYTLPAEYPPVTATAAYTATGSTAGTTLVSSLTRTSNAGLITVTATLSDPTFGSGTSVQVGETIDISDTAALCTAKGYCGSGVVLSVTGSNVTYTMSETPSVYGGGGKANIGLVGSTCTIQNKKTNCGNITASSTNLPSAGQANLPGLVRGTNGALTSNNVLMVNFGGGANFDGGTVPGTGTTINVAGATPTGYNGAYPVVAVGASCSVTETHTDGTTRIYTGTPSSGTTVYTLCLNLGASFALKPPSGNGATVASTKATKQNATVTRDITTLVRGVSNCPTSATAIATATTSIAHGFSSGETVTISSASPGPNESAYVGTPTITVTDSTHFTFPVTTSPACTDTKSGMSIAYQQATGGIDKASLINWVRGQDNVGDEQSPGGGVTIRPSVHGDVLHSRPAVINYGGTTGIVAFYGANDGIFRAVNANQPNNTSDSTKPQGGCSVSSTCAIGGIPPGGELWGFIPSEFFPKLPRLYSNSPVVDLYGTPAALTPKAKDYFLDGPTAVYQDSANNKAYIYLSARRGGRVIYALDVSDPTTPKFLWKKGCPNYTNNTGCDTGFAELGQTWSQPKVARIHGNTNPVLIFGAGYDGNGYDADGTAYAGKEDTEPQGTDTMGRGVFIVDAFTGNLLWRAGPGTSSNTCVGTPCQVQDMKYSVASDITLLDRNFDGYIDRLYATDTGGNIWRVDLEPSTSSTAPSTWQVTKLAALGGSGTGTKRKFMFGPDVVPTKNFDAVLAGTGDREHPLAAHTDAMGVVNRFYMIQDRNVGMNGALLDGTSQPVQPTVVDNSAPTSAAAPSPVTLFDATSATYNAASSAFNGFYLVLNQNMQQITSGSTAGEKVVNAPTTVGGFTYFGTNQPTASSANVCTPNLGNARGYKVNFITGASGFTLFDGGGLPPSPVFGLVTVKVNGVDKQLPFLLGGGSGGDAGCVGADCKSSLGGQKPPIPVPPKKKRTFWYRDVDR